MTSINWTTATLIGLGLLTGTIAAGTMVPHGVYPCANVAPAKAYGPEATATIRIILTNQGGPGHYRLCLQDEQGLRERIELMLTDGDDHVAEMHAPPKIVTYGIAHGGSWMAGATVVTHTVDLAKCPGQVYEARMDSRTGLFDYSSEDDKGCYNAASTNDGDDPALFGFGGDGNAPAPQGIPGWASAALLFGTLSVGIGFVAWTRVPALRVLALGLFTRLLQPDLLRQATRARIQELVRDEPGIHAREIALRLELAHGVVDYHLAVLTRSNFLTRLRVGGFRRYFEQGRYAPSDMTRMATLRSGRLTEFLEEVRARPGSSPGDLARRLGMSKSQASKVIRRLEQAGFVRRRVEGRRVLVDASPANP